MPSSPLDAFYLASLISASDRSGKNSTKTEGKNIFERVPFAKRPIFSPKRLLFHPAGARNLAKVGEKETINTQRPIHFMEGGVSGGEGDVQDVGC